MDHVIQKQTGNRPNNNSGNIQGTFRELSGNMQGTLRGNSLNIQ
jgi:hypothetical protein